MGYDKEKASRLLVRVLARRDEKALLGKKRTATNALIADVEEMLKKGRLSAVMEGERSVAFGFPGGPKISLSANVTGDVQITSNLGEESEKRSASELELDLDTNLLLPGSDKAIRLKRDALGQVLADVLTAMGGRIEDDD